MANKMSPWIFLSALCGYVAICGSAVASQQTAAITQIFKRDSDGLTYVFLNGSRSGKPSCAYYDYFIIRDENSNNGKQQLSMLMMAKATGQTVTIIGTGTCTRWVDGEDINAVML
jgi:hypothetical protein